MVASPGLRCLGPFGKESEGVVTGEDLLELETVDWALRTERWCRSTVAVSLDGPRPIVSDRNMFSFGAGANEEAVPGACALFLATQFVAAVDIGS